MCSRRDTPLDTSIPQFTASSSLTVPAGSFRSYLATLSVPSPSHQLLARPVCGLPSGCWRGPFVFCPLVLGLFPSALWLLARPVCGLPSGSWSFSLCPLVAGEARLWSALCFFFYSLIPQPEADRHPSPKVVHNINETMVQSMVRQGIPMSTHTRVIKLHLISILLRAQSAHDQSPIYV
jgi:hypothetical protein